MRAKRSTDGAVRVYVGVGLTKAEALKKAIRLAKRDFLGFAYNAKTGWAKIV